MEETGVPGENHRPAAIQLQTLSLNVLSQPQRPINWSVMLLKLNIVIK